MPQDLRSSNKYKVNLIGNVNYQITGTKLPSNRQVLAVLFYNIRQGKLTVRESSNLTIKECMIFWEKARIPTKILRNSVEKLVKLHGVWQNLQKNSKKTTQVLKDKEDSFVNTLDNLFDIAHVDALNIMKIEEDTFFLQQQRKPGRPGSLVGVDYSLWQKEERTKSRLLAERNRQLKENKTTAISPNSSFLSNSSSTSLIEEHQDRRSPFCEENLLPLQKRGTKDFLSPKLVAALDRCQLSMRDSVYILEAALEALGHNVDKFIINKSSMQRIRTEMRKERAKKIKEDFKNNVLEVVTVHWDGKLLPAISVQNFKEERLPIVATYGNEEKLIAVPKLIHAIGKEQATAVLNAIIDWQLSDKVQIMCCDTTASNTGRFNGACALLEQALGRELILFGCRHHVYELVLKTVFETEIPQITVSADVPLFKKLKNNWSNIRHSNIQNGTSISNLHFQPSEIDNLLTFYLSELENPIVRGDYRELIELSILFLSENFNKTFKIKPPGAMHQARWMARAIYAIKMFLFRDQLKLTRKEKEGLQEVSLFIATTYVKPWMQCNLAVKAPYQDLCFIRAIKTYECVNHLIAEAVLNKFCQHLYYLTEEVAVLSLFDDMVGTETKRNIVASLTKESKFENAKRYVPSKEELRCSLFDKKLCDFVSIKSYNMFDRLKINTRFLTEDPSTWAGSESFLAAKSKVIHLKAVNDSAERADNLMQQFHGLLTVQEEQKQYLLQCVEEHRKMYPNCTKTSLKRKFTAP